MKAIVSLLILFQLNLGLASTEFILNPKVTFVTEHGEPISAIYQSVTAHCWRIEFSEFYFFKKVDSNYMHYAAVLKPNEWTRAYNLYQDKKLTSKHRAYFNSGSIFDAMKKFEVQDNHGNIIGYIEGNFFTKEAAEFLFTNVDNELFATAYLDKSWSRLVIENMENEIVCNCQKHFNFNYGREGLLSYLTPRKSFIKPDKYNWTITLEEDIDFDTRFFWPFICFISEVWWPGQTE